MTAVGLTAAGRKGLTVAVGYRDRLVPLSGVARRAAGAVAVWVVLRATCRERAGITGLGNGITPCDVQCPVYIALY